MNLRMLMTLITVAGLSACGENELGAGGALRFGLLVQYPETDGFAAIARGQEMPLAIQAKSKAALLNDYAFLDGTLTITDPTGAALPVERTAKGKFKATFTRVGAHVLRAEADGLTDSLTVDVAEQAALRLAHAGRSLSTRTAEGRTCTTRLADDAAIPQLKHNQSLNAALVPADGSGQPLLGVLTLGFSGPVTAAKSSGVNANTFTFTPTTTGLLTLRVTDQASSVVTDLTFDVATDDATCPAE